ncbi:MAG: SdiA-regulated domain-containing protein [Patescibacteria group bacterium]
MITRIKPLLALIAITFLFLPVISYSAVSAPSAWPVDSGTNIGTHLDSGYEPSGVLWHKDTSTLFTVWDNGYLTQLDKNGNVLHATTYVGGDLEGITVVDSSTNYIYLLQECPARIIEYNISTWATTGKTWTLSNLPVSCGSEGAEALTYNSDTNQFYVGSQYNGQIYVYNINLSSSATVSYASVINTPYSRDLAGLHYEAETGLIYAVFDTDNTLVEMYSDGTIVNEYELPGNAQEGIALQSACPDNDTSIYIAEDSGALKKYNNYPIQCTQNTSRDDIVIVDNGSSFLSNIQDVISDSGLYDQYTINLAQIKYLGIPQGADMVVISGGTDFVDYINYSTVSLDSDIINNLQNYTGGVVAICGGADIISGNIYTTYYGFDIDIAMAELVPVDSETHTEWLTISQKPGVQFTDNYIAGDHTSASTASLYYGGPVPKNYNLDDLDVIANYTNDLIDPYYSAIDKPAIFAYNNIIYSAVHPESNSSYHDLLLNMISYANGTLIEPEPDPEPIDNDHDGYTVENDCNDNDATVHVNITYYQDLDNDGLGSDVSTSICSSSAPTGYVSNSDDFNDNDHDNDGYATGTDCNDNDAGLTVNHTYYRDADNDSYGVSSGTSFCANNAPTGYVSNHTDCNDTDDSVHSNQAYYQDLDNDGLGSDVLTSICSSLAPLGYVINSDDLNDNDHDNDGVSTDSDCDDNDNELANMNIYYKDNDGDTYGQANGEEFCLNSAPSGYVINNTDLNDTDAAITDVYPPDPAPEPELSISAHYRYIYINDQKIKLFNEKPVSVEVKSTDYYGDGLTEIIVYAVFRNRAVLVTLRVDASENVTIVKRQKVSVARSIKSVKLKIKTKANRFITTINKHKKIWKINRSGKFYRIK